MAARKNKIKHAEKTKRLIGASQLLNRLSHCANGDLEMTGVQVKAAKIVVDKYIPDLARMEHTGKDGGALTFELKAPWIEKIAKARGWA